MLNGGQFGFDRRLREHFARRIDLGVQQLPYGEPADISGQPKQHVRGIRHARDAAGPDQWTGHRVLSDHHPWDRLYFTSSRGDAGDLFVSKLGPKGWSDPERLGSNVNNIGTVEESVSIFEDDQAREVLVFSRRPAGPFVGPGGKIYQSVDGAPATLVEGGPHSLSSDNRPSVTHDGRTIFWDSQRTGSLGVVDIWRATRSNTSEPWSQAVQLSQVNTNGPDTRPFVSWDGEMLLVSAANDMWFATREKISGN